MGICTSSGGANQPEISDLRKTVQGIFIYGPNTTPADISFKDVVKNYSQFERGFKLSELANITDERIKQEYDALNKITLNDAHRNRLDKRFPKLNQQGSNPYKDNLVELDQRGVDPQDTYINASHIHSPHTNFGEAPIIGTQGPMEATAEAFWRMVYKHKVGMIVTLCKTIVEDAKKSECFEYWPEATKDSTTDPRLKDLLKDLKIVITNENQNSQYI